MEPKIGLNLDVEQTKTTVYRINRAYVQAIIQAGAIPVIIPPCSDRQMKAHLKEVQGVLLIGGRDYTPERYGKHNDDTVKPLHPEREEFDFRLGQFVLTKTNLPVLGICGGMQWLNIFYGGSLHIDIDSTFPGLGLRHRTTEHIPAAEHPVLVEKGSQLMGIYRRKVIPKVISSHHQSIDRLGAGLSIEGLSTDGIVEAIAHDTRPFTVGVQWHPEQDFASNKPLFKAFIRAAQKNMK